MPHPERHSIEACCGLLQKGLGDIPEIEAIIAAITPIVAAAWRRTMEQVRDELVLRLQEFEEGEGPDLAVLDDAQSDEERESVLEEFVTALLLAIRVHTNFTLGESAIIRTAARSAFETGLGSTATLSSRRTARLLQIADLDLARWQEYRIDRLADRLEDLVTEYFTVPEVRRELVTGPAPGARGPGFRARPWLDRMAEAMEDAGDVISELTVDSWAYRWNTIGEVRGLELSGVEMAYARAVIDNRTTPFCRWVDGRPIAVKRLTAQANRYVQAVEDGGTDAMQSAWPMASWRRGDGPKQFAAQWKTLRLGLPPYHWRCRTRVVRRT